MRCFKIFAVLALCLLLGACGNVADQITVNSYSLEKLKDIELGGGQLSFVTNLVLDADNCSGSNVELKKCSAVLYNRRGHKIATATSDDSRRHVLRRKRADTVTIPVIVEFENPVAALSMAGLNLEKIEAKEYSIDYDCVVKVGPVSKRFKEKKVPVVELLEKLQK